jgi:insertion element IS1 protein InsB
MNKAYFETHKSGTIRVEMDEMWGFYQDKTHQIWLWWAIDHDTGEVLAYWFGTREHKNLDTLLELLGPLKIGKVYTDGNYAYYERFTPEVLVVTKKNTQKKDRTETSVIEDVVCQVRKGIRFSKTEQMDKIVVGLVINVWFLGRLCLFQ